MPASTLAPEITVGGSPLGADWRARLTGVRVDRGLGLVGRTTLRFVDDGFALSSSSAFALGTKVEVKQFGGSSLFTGTVSGVSLEQSAGYPPELVVTIDDAAQALTRTRRNVSHEAGMVTDFVDAVASMAGLTRSGPQVGPRHDYLLQSGNDLAFLDHLAARSGCIWWVEGASTLRFEEADFSSGTVTLDLRADLDSFSVRASGLQPESVTVNGWDSATLQDVTSEAKATVTPESNFVKDYPGRKAPSGTPAAVLVRDANPKDVDEAALLAKSIFDDAVSEAVVARGSLPVDGRIGPATKVKVTNAGPVSGEYVVSRVEHVYERGGFTTRFMAGPNRPTGLVDTLVAAEDPGFAIQGLLPAVVDNIKDDQQKRRVRVKYAAMGETVVSAWARVLSIGGGSGRGVEFHPEVGDEVLVGFEAGDTRRPVVLGGLFSDKNTFPTAGTGATVNETQVDRRRITSKEGHVFEFGDGAADTEKHILLELKDKKRLRLGADKVDLECKDVDITISNGKASITLAKNGDITIKGQNVNIEAQTNVKAKGGSKVEIEGSAGATLSGAQVTVKGQGTASLESSGQTTVKGAKVGIN